MTTVAIDTGGTFTDCVLARSGQAPVVVKVSSTPADPSRAMLAGIRRLLDATGTSVGEVEAIIHGTTVATNAMLERRWARVGLLTTEGFRDVLEIGDQMRPQLYGLRQQRPRPLVPRERRLDVPERLWADGRVDRPLDEDAVRAALQRFAEDGVESVAISLLFSFVDARHERRVAELAREVLPGAHVSASHEVSPTVREHPRTSTTVVNAALAPVVQRYLARLQASLAELGLATSRLHVMQSNGGTASARSAGAASHKLLVSGPAGGVVAAGRTAGAFGRRRLLTFDMGGTSSDVGAIVGGRIAQRQDTVIDGAYPVTAPTADIHTIGAGGGSIAWRSEDGRLRVGPTSAGADPGPACYGRGGTRPTVTDADLVLGRLGVSTTLGGELTLRHEPALASIERLAEQLDLEVLQTAAGILDVAHATMAGALRVVSSRRGHDPRDFALVAFGGAGPLHATALARDLGISEVLVPPLPGAFSAVGLVHAELRQDLQRAVNAPLEHVPFAELTEIYAALEGEARTRLLRESVEVAGQRSVRYAAIRYLGQDFALEVRADDAETCAQLAERFHAEHERVYGQADRSRPVELVTVRVEATGRSGPPPTEVANDERQGGRPASTREVWFADGGYQPTSVLDRRSLQPGEALTGPLVIEQADATALVEPGDRVEVLDDGTLLVSLEAAR